MDRISRKAVQAVPGLVAHIIRRLTLVGWEDSFEHGLDAAFAARSAPGARFHIPTSEANFDLDRFMAKYFLDGLNGKPDPKKTTTQSSSTHSLSICHAS